MQSQHQPYTQPRPIKFRVWDASKRKMYYLLENRFSFGTGEHDRAVSWEDVFAEQRPELLPLQYIGINDIRGREIYEGDLVVVSLSTSDDVFVIKFGDNVFYGVASCTKVNATDLGDMTVVGNVYENPTTA